MLILAADPQFDFTKTFLAATGLSTLAVGLISAVVQYFLKMSNDRRLAAFQAELTRQLESHKDSLRRDADAEVEKLRNKLRLDSFVHETRFRSLHEQQAESIRELFNRLSDHKHQISMYILTRYSDAAEGEKQWEKSVSLQIQLTKYLGDISIYLTKDSCDMVYDAIIKLGAVRESHNSRQKKSGAGGIVDYGSGNVAMDEMRSIAGPVLDDLRAKFRKLIGVEEN